MPLPLSSALKHSRLEGLKLGPTVDVRSSPPQDERGGGATPLPPPPRLVVVRSVELISRLPMGVLRWFVASYISALRRNRRSFGRPVLLTCEKVLLLPTALSID